MAMPLSSAASHGPRGAARNSRVDETELASWQPIDETQITDPIDLARYQRLSRAIEYYTQGRSLPKVLEQAGVGRRRFFALIARCRSLGPDGRALGLRALVNRSCIRTPVRSKSRDSDAGLPDTAGFGGLFRKLLRDHPAIEQELVARLRRKGEHRLAPNQMNFRHAHRAFVDICKKQGLGDNDYPLNTESQARAPLRRWLKSDFMTKHAIAWFAAEVGPDAAQAASYAQGNGQDTLPEPPWGAVQIDEQTVDVLARIDLLNENGEVEALDVERFQVIRVVAVTSGANLAWAMVMARQVTAADLVAVIWDAINGQPPARAAVTGLSYQPGAGYPAGVIEALRFAVMSVVYLDNNLAHLAADLQRTLLDVCGARVRLGRPGVPQERAKVESEIKLMAQRLLHQMPATTGSSPRSALRKRARRPIEMRIDGAELAHCIDTYLANTNVSPSAACRYDAPLSWLRRQLEAGRIQPVYLPVAKRCPHLFYPPSTAPIKADMDHGRRPFVNFMGARYSSDALSRCFNLVGTKFAIRCDPRDLRVIWLYEIGTGHQWGPLRALGRWGGFPHDMRIRKMYLLFKRKAEFSDGPADDPLERLYSHLRARASTSRLDASRLGYLMTYLEGWTDIPESVAAACHRWRESQIAAQQAGTLALPAPSSAPPAVPVPTASGDPAHQGSAPTPPDPAPAATTARIVTFSPIARRRIAG